MAHTFHQHSHADYRRYERRVRRRKQIIQLPTYNWATPWSKIELRTITDPDSRQQFEVQEVFVDNEFLGYSLAI